MNAIQALIEQIRQHGDPVLAGQAALEAAEARDVIAQLLQDYWRTADTDPGWIGVRPGDLVCRYCRRRADIAIHIPHAPECPVVRGRALLK